MITPLGQRQIFQTANVEAVRMSLQMSEQIQREATRREIAEDHMAEDQDSVHEIAEAEGLRIDERKSGKGQEAPGRESEEEGALPDETEPAESLEEDGESHLDFLA